jgi:uncharacterized protein (TIGR03437 family)
MRSIIFCLALFLSTLGPAWTGSLTGIATLPNEPIVTAMQQDGAGNIYIAGSVMAGAFVAKLSGGGATVQFWKTFAKSGVGALALAADGSILIAGSTSTFPVTSNAAEPQNSSATGNLTGYFARLDTNGNIVYATYLNGSSLALQQFSPSPLAIASDAAGYVYITGQGLFDSTSGALPLVNYYGNGAFVIKLDATGKIVFATSAAGGTAIATDSQGFIYVAGSQQYNYPVPITSGAFQSSMALLQICSGDTGTPDGGIQEGCTFQYVVKLNPTGTELIYGTWLSGSYGAVPAGLWVDGDGNAVVAGSTQSVDYPVTPGAFQTTSFATLPPVQNAQIGIFDETAIPAPPTTGYVTKLNAAGSGLVFSTFLGGSLEDSIVSFAPDSEGNINLAGVAQSPDLPGLTPIPDACRPSYLYPTAFVTRMSADGSALTETQLAYGLVPSPFAGITPSLATFGTQGNATVLVGTSLATLNLFGVTPSFACATDAADMAPLAQIAPGQLVSLFGEGIGGVETKVTFNGVAAPVLYSSPSQINVQVPYEIASQTNVPMQITNGNVAGGSGNFMVTPIQPSAFVFPGYATCQTTITNSLLPVALNADGSENSCDNPASVGDTLTLFVNGLGLAGSQPITGAIASSPATPLNLPVSVSGDVTLVSAESDPGTVNSVWTIRVKITQTEPQNQPQALALIDLKIGGVDVPYALIVWMKPSQQY